MLAVVLVEEAVATRVVWRVDVDTLEPVHGIWSGATATPGNFPNGATVHRTVRPGYLWIQ